MKKTILAVLFFMPYLAIAGTSEVKNTNTDQDGVPIVTDIKHLVDMDGRSMTTEEFLKKWCPGENKTPVTNKTCEKLQNQRYIESSVNSMHR